MITLDFFKTLLDVDLDDTDSDDFLQFILDSAKRFVTQETGVLLEKTNVVDTVLGNDVVFMYLKNRPLNSIIKVTEYYISSDEGVDITDSIKIDDVQFGIIYRDNSYFYSQYKYVIEYNAGYSNSEDTIPKDLEFAIYQIGLKLFGISNNIKEGVTKVQTADGNSFTIDYNLLPDAILQILNAYRLHF